MTDDLAFLTGHLPSYGGYVDEAARHDTDMRVRAFVGEKVSEALERLAGQVSADDAVAGERVLEECMFTDQSFIRRIEHATLDEAAQALLAAADRRLVETAAVADTVTAPELGALLERIVEQFARRYEPLPATI
jgi:hypothetical protein